MLHKAPNEGKIRKGKKKKKNGKFVHEESRYYLNDNACHFFDSFSHQQNVLGHTLHVVAFCPSFNFISSSLSGEYEWILTDFVLDGVFVSHIE